MKIEANITLGDKFIQIVGVEGGECNIRIDGLLDSNQLSGVGYIAEVLRCLKNGRPIDLHFNCKPSNGSQLLLCEWQRSGKLILRSEHATKKWKHAENIDEALARKAVFTCTRELFVTLPARRLVAPTPFKLPSKSPINQ